MNIFTNRTLAWVIAVILIFASVYFGAARAFDKMIDEANSAYINGVRGDGYSIQSDSLSLVDFGYNLVSVAKQAGIPESEYQNVRVAANELKEATSPRNAKGRADNLNVWMTKLKAIIEKEGNSEQIGYANKILMDFRSVSDIISRDGYNDLAKTNNERMSTFPASILRIITRRDLIELYE